MLAAVSVTFTVATGIASTVSVALPVFVSLVAMTLAVPGATAVTRPVVAFTVATAGSLDDHTMVRPVTATPRAASLTAEACLVAAGTIDVAASDPFTVATGGTFTVSVALPVLVSLVAVIVAVPGATAV